MMDIETMWWDRFGDSYGVEFEKARPEYHRLDQTTQRIGALMKLELDLYNGGFLQFFCNWGYAAYLLALEGLQAIGALHAKRILEEAYSILEPYQDDERIRQLWDLPAVLSEEDAGALDRLDRIYWEDQDGIMENMLAVYAKDD